MTTNDHNKTYDLALLKLFIFMHKSTRLVSMI